MRFRGRELPVGEETSEHAGQVIWASSFRRILNRQVALTSQSCRLRSMAVGL